MKPAVRFGRLAAAISAALLVGSCGPGTNAADTQDDAPPLTVRTTVPGTSTTNQGTVAGARVEPATTVASLFAPVTEGPNLGTWITVDRAGKSADGARIRSHSDLLFQPPLSKAITLYSTADATPTRSN